MFLAPALALFLLLVLAPIVVAGYASLYKWNGFGLPENFIGLDNYTRAFGDPTFRGDLRRGLVLVVLSLVVQLPVALALAMLLNQPIRGRAIYRLIFFAPYGALRGHHGRPVHPGVLTEPRVRRGRLPVAWAPTRARSSPTRTPCCSPSSWWCPGSTSAST